MKLTIRGYEPIVIPPEAVVPMEGSFDGDTPYVAKVVARCKQRSYIAGKLPVKILCLEALRKRIEGRYKSYSEPMAGIGISARIFGKGLGNVMSLSDFDYSCRKVLRANFKVRIDGDDIFNSPHTPFPADLIFLDFNDCTFKRAQEKYAPVFRRAFVAARKYLVINDCSPFYLRYGAQAHEVYSKLLGQEINSVESYFKAVAVWYKTHGWHLTAVAYFSETAFLLLSREDTDAGFLRQRFDYNDVPEGMVTVSDA